MKNEFDFVAGMHLGGQLFFNHYRLMVDFYSNSEVIEDHNIAVERLNYFMTEIISRSIFVAEDQADAIMKYTEAGIPVLTVPSPGPFDPLVLAVIATKMNCILDETLVITQAELTSRIGGDITYVWDSEDEEDEMHNFVNDTDEVKWWASSDPRFASYPDGVEIEEFEEEQPFLMTWDRLNLHWTEEREEEEENDVDVDFTPDFSSDSGGKVIRFSDFDPSTKK